MRAISAAVLILLTAAAAHAQQNGLFPVMPSPGSEYDKPYTGTLIEIRVGVDLMGRLCPKFHGYPVTFGCSHQSIVDDQCLILIVEDKILNAAGWTYELIRQHEISHCNGWPADHPDARMMAPPLRPAIGCIAGIGCPR